MRIGMIGTGYVGLVSGACFAEFGVNVICVDRDEEKIARLVKGETPIYEPGLNDLVKGNVEAGRLVFTADLKTAIVGADAIFIAVGTPATENHSVDLTYVTNVAAMIAEHMTDPKVVVRIYPE